MTANNSRKSPWRPIETAPRDGMPVMGRIMLAKGRYLKRKTWWGKTSHVPLYGWCWMKNPHDFENVDLWTPTHWKPFQPRKPPRHRAYFLGFSLNAMVR